MKLLKKEKSWFSYKTYKSSWHFSVPETIGFSNRKRWLSWNNGSQFTQDLLRPVRQTGKRLMVYRPPTTDKLRECAIYISTTKWITQLPCHGSFAAFKSNPLHWVLVISHLINIQVSWPARLLAAAALLDLAPGQVVHAQCIIIYMLTIFFFLKHRTLVGRNLFRHRQKAPNEERISHREWWSSNQEERKKEEEEPGGHRFLHMYLISGRCRKWSGRPTRFDRLWPSFIGATNDDIKTGTLDERHSKRSVSLVKSEYLFDFFNSVAHNPIECN